MDLKVGSKVNVTLVICGKEQLLTPDGERNIYSLCYSGDLKNIMKFTLKLKDEELEDALCK